MNKYKIFSKKHETTIETVIQNYAIPLSLENIAKKLLSKKKHIISRQDIIEKIPYLITTGLKLLRKNHKKIYELFHGCILATFLDKINPHSSYMVCYPENESYDFLIIKTPLNKKPDFKLDPEIEIYKSDIALFKVEFAELTHPEDLEGLINKKLNYTDRVLLISIDFVGKIDFKEFFDKASNINQNRFETIWLVGQFEHPEDKNKLYYFIAELVKYKKILSLFELQINWGKIEKEIKNALNI